MNSGSVYATVISKKVRQYLDGLGYDMVDLFEPMWDQKYWHVLVTFDDQPRGTVITDSEGNVLEDVSYPHSDLTNV